MAIEFSLAAVGNLLSSPIGMMYSPLPSVERKTRAKFTPLFRLNMLAT